MTDFNTVEELDRHVPMKPKSSRDVLIVGPQRITTLEAEVKRLREMLKSIEWVKDPSYPDWHFCPSCDATSDCMLSLKHADNCKLHAILD